MKTILDAFESFFQEELTLASLDAVQRLRDPRDWLPNLLEAEEDFLRTYLPSSNQRETTRGFIDFNLFFKEDVQVDYARTFKASGIHWSYEKLSKKILGYLLYYPALCIQWPRLREHFGLLLKESNYRKDKQYWRRQAAGLLDQLRLICVLRPLIEQGHLQFFSVDYFDDDHTGNWLANYSDYWEDYMEFLRSRYPGGSDSDLREHAQVLNQQIYGAELCGAFPIALDGEMSDIMRFHYESLKNMLNREGILQNSMAAFLQTVALPDLISLELGDLMSVRKNDLVFAEWRQDLVGLMSHYSGGQPREMDEAELRRAATEVLTPRRQRILESVRAARFSNLVKENAIGFGLGVIGGLAVSGEIVSSILSGLAGGILSFSKSMLAKKSMGAEEVVLKWYSSFLDQAGEHNK